MTKAMNALKMSHDRNAKPIKRISGYNSKGLLLRVLAKQSIACFATPQNNTYKPTKYLSIDISYEDRHQSPVLK